MKGIQSTPQRDNVEDSMAIELVLEYGGVVAMPPDSVAMAQLFVHTAHVNRETAQYQLWLQVYLW